MKIDVREEDAMEIIALESKLGKAVSEIVHELLALGRDRLVPIIPQKPDGLWKIVLSSAEYQKLDGLEFPAYFDLRANAEWTARSLVRWFSIHLPFYLNNGLNVRCKSFDGFDYIEDGARRCLLDCRVVEVAESARKDRPCVSGCDEVKFHDKWVADKCRSLSLARV